MNDGGTVSGAALRTLGRYQLVRMIGRGGMGEVWLGEDPRLHRQVAIKTLPPHNRDDQEFSLRFEREAQALAALNHPHILPVHDYGNQSLPNGQVITFIVMPFISGGSLSDRIETYVNNRTLVPQHEALTYLAQAAEAIDYAHEQGLIHRDIKPANMLLRNDNWLLLADFGIARILSNSGNLTQTGVGIGTPEYMAPEQAHGKAVPASDNYSLAVLAYQLFTGRVPFKADTGYATTIQHMTLPPPPPRQINPAIPPAVENILLQGLAKDPTQRPASTRAFVAALQQAANTPTYNGQFPSYSPSSFEATYADPRAQAALVNSQQAGMPTAWNTDPAGKLQMSAPQEQAAGVSRRKFMIAGGAAAAVVLVGGAAAWALTSKPAPKPKPTPVAQKTAAVQATPTPGPDAPYVTIQAHTKTVNSIAWAPKNNMLASIGEDGFLMLWDAGKLQPQQQSPSPIAKQERDGTNMMLAWSPDGAMLAVGNAFSSDNSFTSSQLFLYKGDLSDAAPGSPATIPGSNVMQGISWVQNKYVAVLNLPDGYIDKEQAQLVLVDSAAPKTQIAPIAVKIGLTPLEAAVEMASSPDGTQLAICTQDGLVVGQPSVVGNAARWQPSTKAPLKYKNSNFSYDNEVNTVSWEPNGKDVIALSTQTRPGSTIVGWDWKNSAQAMFLVSQGVGMNLTTLQWCPAPTSMLIAAGSKQGGDVVIWDVTKNRTPVRTLKSGGITAAVSNLSWSSDGVWLAASYEDDNHSILIWKLQ